VQPDIESPANFVAGFVAAEGTFTRSGDTPKFSFAIGLRAADAGVCHELRRFFSVGHLHFSPRRKPHYDDEVSFHVRSFPDLLGVVLPFMDEHLPPSYKREQYLAWRERLLDYWEHRAKRVRHCMVDGCDSPRRAHGLCRRHLYSRLGV
jgi:hypothetical protein